MRRPFRLIRTVLFTGGLLAASLPVASAQQPERPRPAADRGQLGELLRQRADALKLSDSQRADLRRLVVEYRGKLRSSAFREAFEKLLSDEQQEAFAAVRGRGLVAADDSVRVTRDVLYHNEEGVDPRLLSLDIYAPVDAEQLPVMLFVHGGGWRQGDKGQAAEKGRFFSEHGYLLVSVNYRLSPAVQHPVHVEDVVRAIAWVKAEIAAYGGDPQRVSLMGHSAGAHLAALAGVDTDRLQAVGLKPADIEAVVCLDGAGYDVAWQVTELGGDVAGAMYRTAFGESEEAWNDASPVVHAKTATDLPQYLIFHVANREASRLQSQRLAEAVRASGGEAAVVSSRGKTHGTINREIGQVDDPVTGILLRVLTALDSDEPPFTPDTLSYEAAVLTR
jgi:acetyl esterase/lipase